MKVTRITAPPGKNRPQCVHPVKPNKYAYRNRVRSNKHTELCGRPSTFRVDTKPYCQQHAGFVCLMVALESSEDLGG